MCMYVHEIKLVESCEGSRVGGVVLIHVEDQARTMGANSTTSHKYLIGEN